MKKIKILMLICIISAINTLSISCTKVYYVGQTTEPLRIYSTLDTNSLVNYTILPGSKVLTKKKSKKFHYVVFQSYKGYAYKPNYSGYHKYNFSSDGELYGYSTRKPRASNSGSGSGGSVNVKGYYRKNGTYVKPHTRSASRKRY